MPCVCALREYETEEKCFKECPEFYSGNGVCSEEYWSPFCAYQNKEGAEITPYERKE